MEHLLKVRKNSIIEQPVQRIIIGVAGGSAAGKTTLCQNINRQMAFDRNFKVQMISLDSFYKSLQPGTNAAQYNFDHPNALDFDLAYQTLKLMKESNQKVPIPQYSFIQHKRLPDPTYASPANIILFEGLMAFHDPRIRDLMTYKVFITCDDDIRLCRRIKRDTTERGRSIQSVLLQYNKFVKDSFRNFILPTMIHADIIIPGFRNNRVSVDFIVQHIKNIARRINYRQKASRTKIYIFGQNQLYDFEYRQSQQSSINMFQESFLVFPTAQEHKKQLQFFMNRLVSQTFSYEYYEQIYICQFIKIQKSLLNQLIQLKQYKKKDIEIFTEHNIDQITNYNLYEKKVHVIFFPTANSNKADRLVKLIKTLKQKGSDDAFVIMTIFCDLNFPRIIYKLGLSNVILINLFIIANNSRFKQTMQNNLIYSEKKPNWFQNDQILANQGAYVLSNDLKILYHSDFTLERKKYDIIVSKLPKTLSKRTVDENVEKVNQFSQKLVYGQQHENLCGYHTLVNIILLNKKQDYTSKDKFIKYYSILSKFNQSQNFESLERDKVDHILQNTYFHGLNIGVFYYSSNYIINQIPNLRELQKLFTNVKEGVIDSFYLIMGVYDHFFLLEISENSINLYDSANISLTDIMNSTDEQYKSTHALDQKIDEYDLIQHKKHMKNTREALEIILSVMRNEKTFKQVYLEKRIDEIVIPFLQLKDEKQIKHFFNDQYPFPVIMNDLLKPLQQLGQQTLDQKYRKILAEWRNRQAIKWGIMACSKSK